MRPTEFVPKHGGLTLQHHVAVALNERQIAMGDERWNCACGRENLPEHYACPSCGHLKRPIEPKPHKPNVRGPRPIHSEDEA